eukprot:54452-Amphidinium_carterae.1
MLELLGPSFAARTHTCAHTHTDKVWLRFMAVIDKQVWICFPHAGVNRETSESTLLDKFFHHTACFTGTHRMATSASSAVQ